MTLVQDGVVSRKYIDLDQQIDAIIFALSACVVLHGLAGSARFSCIVLQIHGRSLLPNVLQLCFVVLWVTYYDVLSVNIAMGLCLEQSDVDIADQHSMRFEPRRRSIQFDPSY